MLKVVHPGQPGRRREQTVEAGGPADALIAGENLHRRVVAGVDHQVGLQDEEEMRGKVPRTQQWPGHHKGHVDQGDQCGQHETMPRNLRTPAAGTFEGLKVFYYHTWKEK